MRVPYHISKKRTTGPPPGLVNSIFLGIVYGYFAMRFHNDPVDCYANDSDDQALDEDTTEGNKLNYATNVGAKF